jgi:hypothetical protein
MRHMNTTPTPAPNTIPTSTLAAMIQNMIPPHHMIIKIFSEPCYLTLAEKTRLPSAHYHGTTTTLPQMIRFGTSQAVQTCGRVNSYEEEINAR